MNKATKYAINGAVISGGLTVIFNALKQLNEIEQNPDLKFNWKRLFITTGIGTIAGGVGGFVIGSLVDHNNSKIKPIDTDKKILSFVDKAKLDKTDIKYVKLNKKATQLSQMLRDEYGDIIHSMPRLGSTEAGTALKKKFDIDQGINFKPNSFPSTEDMFLSVFSLFKEKVGHSSIKKVRKQKKSIGVFVEIDSEIHKIDIVPIKLTKNGKGSGYLCLNDNSLFGETSYIKTNIKILKQTKLSPTQQKIAIALKHWKSKNNLPLSSHLLQHLILDAYQYSTSIPTGLTSKIVMVLDHIADSLNVAVIKSRENTNNVITDIPELDKEKIIQAAKEAVEEYNYQPNSIVSTIV